MTSVLRVALTAILCPLIVACAAATVPVAFRPLRPATPNGEDRLR